MGPVRDLFTTFAFPFLLGARDRRWDAGASEDMMAKKTAAKTHDGALQELRKFGLGYPGAHTKSPWPEHLDLAVNDKTFSYLSIEGQPLSISCKLPQSSVMALNLPFVSPTGYGLGKSGWVTATFSPDQDIPVDLLKEWIDESYRAQAPKRLLAQLGTAEPPAKKPASKARLKPTTSEKAVKAKPKAKKARR